MKARSWGTLFDHWLSISIYACDWLRFSGGMIDRPTCFFADDRISHLQHIVAETGFTFSSFPVHRHQPVLQIICLTDHT
jgi:hypothetical protein